MPLWKPLNLKDLGPRILSGLILIALALGTNFYGGVVFALFWLAASCAIFWEWLGLRQNPRSRRPLLAGIAALAFVAALNMEGLFGLSLLVGLLALGLVAALSPARLRLWNAAGLFYSGSLVVSTINLRFSFPLGVPALIWLFAIVWGTDVMAYFGGRLIGGPKLWPRISPSKTWAGFLCGVTCGALAGWGVAPGFVPAGPVLVLGLVAGALAQGGDLFESALKRRCHVKDSSNLIPGHGGVMDRLDGFIAACLFAFIFGALRSGLFAPANGLFNW